MKKSILAVSLCAGSVSLNSIATAQDDLNLDTIVIESSKVLNAELGIIKPELTLDSSDISAFGVTSLEDLLTEISTATGGGGGRPELLLNGKRISGFREIRKYPPEALDRVEVLSEDAALRYGFRPDKKVINFILKEYFHSLTGEVSWETPSDGGLLNTELELNNLRLAGENRRWNTDFEFNTQDALFESDRDIFDADEDNGSVRTLVPEKDTIDLVGSFSHKLPGKINATYLGAIVNEKANSVLGANEDGNLNIRDQDTLSGEASFVLNKMLDTGNWTLNGSYTYENVDQVISIATLSDDIAESQTTTDEYSFDAVYFRNLFSLPAGNVGTTFQAGYSSINLSSTSISDGEVEDIKLSRDNIIAQVSLDVPILTKDFALGAFSTNVNGQLSDLSDAGDLLSLGYGLTWQPVNQLQMMASSTYSENAPNVSQLGAAFQVTPNSRVFDFTTGQTVENIEKITGGNAALLNEENQLLRLNASWKPFSKKRLDIVATYTDERIENAISSFPDLSPIIEEAYPERVVRNDTGQLILIDTRALNFAEKIEKKLNISFNWSKSLKAGKRPNLSPEERQKLRSVYGKRRSKDADRPPQKARQGENAEVVPSGQDASAQGKTRRGGRPSGRGRGPWGRGQGRIYFRASYDWALEDTLLISSGGEKLDLLNGDTVSSSGGTPEHTISARGGYSKGAVGLNSRMNWESGTQVNGSELGILSFDPLLTIDARIRYNFDRKPALIAKYPILSATSISLAVDNIFNEKRSVTSEDGNVPVSYQPDIFDPLGRTIEFKLRKLIF